MQNVIIIGENEEWEFLEKVIMKLRNILDGRSDLQFLSDEYIRTYTIVYDMCNERQPNDYPQHLYDKIKDAFSEYLNLVVIPSLQGKHDEFMLRELVNRWANHKVLIRWFCHLFRYLDRYFIPRWSLPSLCECGITCFRDLVYKVICTKASDFVISMINKEREGEQIDHSLVKNVLDIFLEFGMEYYEDDFENEMLIDAASYYSRKASKWILEDTCPTYLLKCEECLKREKERVSHYLHFKSEEKLMENVQKELLVVRLPELIEKENSGFRTLLQKNKVEDLSRMFTLLSRISGGLELLVTAFKEHITDEGNALFKQAEDTADAKRVCVIKVIEMHDKYMAHVNDCFDNNSTFLKALMEAFQSFCNKRGSTSAELLSSYCDDVLKKGVCDKLSDEAIEEALDKFVRLLTYMNDKDLFVEFCRKKMSRRLLFDRNANDDHERSLLTKLKVQCGSHCTSKMEGMVMDITLAKENQTNFEEYLSNNPNLNLGLDLTVTVLTTRYWPTYKSSDLNLPSEMLHCQEIFKSFYETHSKKRKLSWMYSSGTCNIVGKFDRKSIEIIVNIYQAAALLLFNKSDRLSYTEIMDQLNLRDEDIIRLLHPLCCAKYKILIKYPNTNTIAPTDFFEFNAKFTDKMRRIKIVVPPINEKKKVIEDVEKDRRYVIDATIVRIMKSRKVLSYQLLLAECVEQMKQVFKPDIKIMKLRIEDLILRDFMERDKKDPRIFRYIP